MIAHAEDETMYTYLATHHVFPSKAHTVPAVVHAEVATVRTETEIDYIEDETAHTVPGHRAQRTK